MEVVRVFAYALASGKLADAARKGAAYAAMWMFLSLLCGAFVASLLATYGGRLRDRHDLYDEPLLQRDAGVSEPVLH